MTIDQVDTGLDRRQKRWRELHDRLYDAACELFLEADFSSTSVDQIAERADVARKTAFNHYPRKRDFITEWGRRRRVFVEELLSDDVMSSASLEKALRHYFAGLAASYERQRSLAIRMLTGWRESGGPFDTDPHPLVPLFRSMLGEAGGRGEVRGEIDLDRTATVLYSSYFGILYDWVEGGDDETAPFDLQDACSRMLDVLLRGLLVDDVT